ncbi:MAG: A24 family peptidase C-terminal domain-containing protein [Desulfurococcaceae archaeon]
MHVQIDELVEIVKIVSTLITLVVLSIQDWRTRELDGRIVYSYLMLSILMFFTSTMISHLPLETLLFYTFFSVVTTSGLFILLYITGLAGDGDVYVATSLGLMFPYITSYKFTLQRIGLLPPCMVVVFYASAFALVLMIANSTWVLIRYRDAVSRIPLKYKFIIPLIGRPVRIREYLRGKYKYYYPLQFFEVRNEGVLVYFKLFTSINSKEVSSLHNLINKGLLSMDDYIWITPGLPFILYLLIGFILMLVFADKPILFIISKIISLK